MRKNIIVAFGAMAIMSMTVPMVAYAEAGSNQQSQATQSPRWIGLGDRWQVSDNVGGYIKNCWYQDEVSGRWYMIGGEDGTIMYAGLVTDQSTGKSYLLNTNHDGTYGAMLTTDGVYNLNGKQVYLQFDQAHLGSYGAILRGLSEVKNAGISEKQLPSIPTDTAQQTPPVLPQIPPQTPPPSNNNKTTDEEIREKYGITDELWEQNDFPDPEYGSLS